MWLQRNYPFFIMFISSSTLLCTYVFTFSVVNILRKKGTFWSAMSHDILSVILIVYCFIAVWFVGGLTVFHFYLICTNQVTFLLFIFLTLIFFYSTIRIIVSYWNWSYFLSDEDRSYRLILLVCMVCILVHGIMAIW